MITMASSVAHCWGPTGGHCSTSSRAGGGAAPQLVSTRRRRPQQRHTAVSASASALTLADAAAAAAAPAGGDLQSLLPPLAILGVAAAGVVGLRLSLYSQLEYITAAMLARHVKPGARVLQLGGGTRDLFYYPDGTVQVTVGGADVVQGLWEQAGVQAKVPVQAVKAEADRVLSSQAGSTFDSVVVLNGGGAVQLWDNGALQLAEQAQRVLKPGGTLVFVQRLRSGGPLQALLGGGGGAADPAAIEALQRHGGWASVQWDPALEGSDPHAAGVATKPAAADRSGASVDRVAFEQVMKKGGGGKKKGAQQQQQQEQQRPTGGGFS